MDDSETYMDMQIVKRDTRTPSTATHVRESKVNIGNRPNRLICLLCLVTSVLIVIVAGLGIYGMHSNLRHQFTEMETKYRSVNETNAQICELLTSRRVQACSQDWIRSEDRCYFISKLEISYDGAKKHCSKLDAKLLEINSKEEANVVSNSVIDQYRTYWIGKCEEWEEAPSLMFKDYTGSSVCGQCESERWRDNCNLQNRFICEKSANLLTNIPEMIQDLCQQSAGPT